MITCLENQWHYKLPRKPIQTLTKKWASKVLYNAMIQLHFGCTWSAWYPNFITKIDEKIPNHVGINFCVKLDKIYHISDWEFRYINLLSVNKRCEQPNNTMVLKFATRSCLECCIKQRNVFFKLEHPFRKKNKNKKTLWFISPSLWN